MTIRNKIKVEFYLAGECLEDGCLQENDEINTSWQPINFSIYNSLFLGLIEVAIDEWLSDNTIEKNVSYEVIFVHVIERDAGGAAVGERFEPIYQEYQSC